MLLSQDFDRTRPLWEFRLVEAYEGGGSAVILRIHHCLADGIGLVRMVCVSVCVCLRLPACVCVDRNCGGGAMNDAVRAGRTGQVLEALCDATTDKTVTPSIGGWSQAPAQTPVFLLSNLAGWRSDVRTHCAVCGGQFCREAAGHRRLAFPRKRAPHESRRRVVPARCVCRAMGLCVMQQQCAPPSRLVMCVVCIG